MSGLRVLCVDDENVALQMLMSLCKKIDAVGEIAGFTSSEQSLAYAREHCFDVALLDIDMPVIDGLALAKKLRAMQPNIFIVIVSAYGEYALKAYRADCNGYWVKPISEEELRHQFRMLGFKVNRSPIFIRTFGDFEVFFQDKPIHFTYQNKSKEVLALLTWKGGSACTYQELATYLWEDDDDHTSYLKRIKKDLTDTFKRLTGQEIFYCTYGHIALNRSAVRCDYFDNLDSFRGEFMNQYSWAEPTRADLLRKRDKKV